MIPESLRAPAGAPSPLKPLVALLLPCIAALCTTPACAAEDPARPGVTKAGDKDAGGAATDKLDTVTVTATRRREPIRDVPLRVETLRVDQLERSGAASLSDYMGSLPGVDVKTDGGPGRSEVSMRGVTTGDQTIATVGIYIDDVAFGSSSAFVNGASTALEMSLLDLHHIEVLRGPQGTLYGAGAMGGLLKYVTNEPDTYTFSGKASVGMRSTRSGGTGHTESAVINVPLSEDVAGLRIAAFNDHDGGYIKSVGLAAGNNVNGGNTRGARLSLLVEPLSKLKLRLTATGQDIRRDGTSYVEYDIATGKPTVADLTRQRAVRDPYDLKIRLLSADVEYDFGWARLNVIGSSQRSDSHTNLDATLFIGDPSLDQVSLTNTLSLRKNTAEVRLTSARGPVEWLVGLYHDKETGGFDQRLWGHVAADGSTADLLSLVQPSNYSENAAYGDVTFNFAPQWSLTAGARLAKNRQTYASALVGGPVDPVPATDTSKTYLATLRYSLSAVSSVYVRAASGYRPGGPNPPAIDAGGHIVPGAPMSFAPDSLWSYELGYKADLLGKRLALEAALYDIRWNDLQQNVNIGATTVITNAGKAEVKGFELAARYQVDDHWNVDGSLAYTDPRLLQTTYSLGTAGSRLPNSAKFAATLGLRYSYALAGHPSYAGINARYVGQRNAGFDSPTTAVPNFSLPAYTLVDAQWGMAFGAWQLATFVRNLTDKRALVGANTHLVAFGLPLGATVAQPRTLGATLTLAF